MSTAHAFANNFWGKEDVGYQRLVQRMHHAKLTVEELQSFYKERQSIEYDYARKLSALSKKALGSKETGSLRRSLDVVRSTTDQMATSHDTVARQIQQEFFAPLESFSSNIRERRKTSEDMMARLTKAKKTQNDVVEKARSKYEQECHKVTGFKAQQNLLMGKELERNNAKLERAGFNVEQLERDYQAALNVLAQTTENWNSMWKTTCDKFQELEEERLSYIKSNLWDFANATSTACVNDDEGFEAIRVGLEKCDAASDIMAFVAEQGTGGQIMDAPEFTNYLSGFTRDNSGDNYKLAQFGLENEEEGANRSFQSANDSYTSNQILSMSHSSHLSMDNTPNLRPSTNKASMVEDDGYASSSPYQGSMSPASSMYSSATTMSASPQQGAYAKKFDQQQFEPTPVEQKRRSWAKPFKRQSSPDLSKVWKALGDSQSSTNSGRFSSPEPEYETHMRIEEPSQSQTIASRQQQYSASPSNIHSPPQTSRRNVASKMVQEQDPMLAAIDKLKTPPLGSKSSPKKQMARPASMPGIAAMSQGGNRQPQTRHQGQAQQHQMLSAASRRPVGSQQPAVQAPYPENFTPQSIPARAPERERRHSFNPNEYVQQEQSFETKRMNRRSAEVYTHAQRQQQVQAQQQQQQAQLLAAQQHSQQPQQRPRSKTQSSPRRPKSVADLTADRSLLPSRTSEGKQVIAHARAQFDFRARIPMEVNFRKNDILLVTHMQEDGWWEAEVLTTKAAGVAPGNFLERLS